MNKIKIAHVMYSFTHIGGLENGVINIINNLDQNKFFHIICSLTSIGKIANRILSNNVKFIELKKRSGNDLTLPIKLYRIFKKEEIDVVHLRNWAALVEGFIAGKSANVKKIIYSEHGRHFEDVWEKKKIKFYIKRYCFSKVDVLLSVSQNLADELATLYNLKRRIEVIINGVDTGRFQPAPCNLNILEKEKQNLKLIGTVCRLDPGKNLDQLILDIGAIADSSLKLLIAGDGPERERLEDLIRKNGLLHRVFLLGNRDDVPAILNCLDLFVLPSLSEGLSNVILEAMASGLPVVAYDVGGNRELVQNGKGGFLVPLKDRRALIEAVLKILRNGSLATKMGDFNRNLVLQKFSLPKMAESYERLYSSLSSL